MTSASIDIDPEASAVTVYRQPTKPQITPLPKIQLCVLLALCLAGPITGTVIYPFINQAGYRFSLSLADPCYISLIAFQLLNDFGITHGDPRKTGYYVGL